MVNTWFPSSTLIQNIGTVFKLETGQDEDKTTTYVPIVAMLPEILGPIFCDEEKRHGICTEL